MLRPRKKINLCTLYQVSQYFLQVQILGGVVFLFYM
jgi:hypothetical protein